MLSLVAVVKILSTAIVLRSTHSLRSKNYFCSLLFDQLHIWVLHVPRNLEIKTVYLWSTSKLKTAVFVNRLTVSNIISTLCRAHSFVTFFKILYSLKNSVDPNQLASNEDPHCVIHKMELYNLLGSKTNNNQKTKLQNLWNVTE